MKSTISIQCALASIFFVTGAYLLPHKTRKVVVCRTCGSSQTQVKNESPSGGSPVRKAAKANYLVAQASRVFSSPQSVGEYITDDATAILARFTGVVRQGYNRIVPEVNSQYTVFTALPLHFVHDDGVRQPSIRVFVEQGERPSKSGRGPPGWRISGEPLPRVGKKYLMFLQTMASLSSGPRNQAFDSFGKLMWEASDYYIVPPRTGLWQVNDGVLCAPNDPGLPEISPTTSPRVRS